MAGGGGVGAEVGTGVNIWVLLCHVPPLQGTDTTRVAGAWHPPLPQPSSPSCLPHAAGLFALGAPKPSQGACLSYLSLPPMGLPQHRMCIVGGGVQQEGCGSQREQAAGSRQE